MHVLFAHGKESGPWGSKIQALAAVATRLGCQVDSIDYTDLPSPEDRVQRLLHTLRALPAPVLLVGSSMGGYVSLVAAGQHPVQGVFLLAPALYLPGYAQQHYHAGTANVEIVHGWSDDVIAVDNVLRFARQAQCSLHVIDGDHRLNTVLEEVCGLFEVFVRRQLQDHALNRA